MLECTKPVDHVIDRLWCHLAVKERTREQQNQLKSPYCWWRPQVMLWMSPE